MASANIQKTVISNEDKFLRSEGKIITISSDGGAKDGRGSFGVVMSIDKDIMARNYSRTPPIHNDIHSYRTEGYGILCGLSLFQEIHNYCKLQKDIQISNNLQVHSDNQSMIKKINKIRNWKITPKQCNEKDMDIIIEIPNMLNILQSTGITVKFKWVKGHQDRTNQQLSTDAKMNCAADTLATTALRLRNLKANINLPSSKAIITLHGQQITANRTHILRNAFQSMQLRQYMATSNNWTDTQTEQIWWKIHGAALNTFPQGQRMILQKYIHSQLPCNQRNPRIAACVQPPRKTNAT
jgi:ribonuclease HI